MDLTEDRGQREFPWWWWEGDPGWQRFREWSDHNGGQCQEAPVRKKNRTNRISDKDTHVGIVLMSNIKLLKRGCENLGRNTKTPIQTNKKKSPLLSLSQTQSAKRGEK